MSHTTQTTRAWRTRVFAVFAVIGLSAATLTAGLLDDFQDVVDVRRAATKRGTARRAALNGAARELRKSDGLVFGDANAAFRGVRRVERRFRRDAEFDAAEATLLQTLTSAAQADRDLLASRVGTLGDVGAEQVLADGLARADAAFARAAGLSDPFRALRALRDAATGLRDAWPPQPDFRRPDVNPNSATFGQSVSPRDRVGDFSAWYFIRGT